MNFGIFVLLSTFVHCTVSISVKCEFHDNGDWWVLKGFYYCNAVTHLEISSPDAATIDSITGTHLNGKSIENVTGFEADNMTVLYFPKGLEKIFKNLKMIDINYGRLKEVHQSDLKPFPELVCLELYENDIEVLEEGLFDYNPKLEMVWFSNNRIFHIHENLFDNLPKLRYLSLDYNRCISLFSENNRTAVLEIIAYSKINCKEIIYLRKMFPEFIKKVYKIQFDLDNLKNNSGNVNESDFNYQSGGVSFWHIFLPFFGGILIGILGFLIYGKYYSRRLTNANITFLNNQYD